MKYIDSEKLIAEINARIERCEKDEEDGYPDTTSPEAILKSVRTNIDSLQQEQPEVELEKEITPSLVENMLCEFGVQSIEDVDSECLADIARHFYELGLNARKEE